MPDDLIRRLLHGERVPLARAISAVENEAPDAVAILNACYEKSGRAFRLGVTGPPGAGKSTLVARLAQEYRRRGETVSVGPATVAPAAQGRGVGTKLFQTVIEREPNARSMRIMQDSLNLASFELLVRIGYSLGEEVAMFTLPAGFREEHRITQLKGLQDIRPKRFADRRRMTRPILV